jgi:hypothetical protein
MTDTVRVAHDVDAEDLRFERKCLTGSLVISSVTIVAGVVGWWVVRFANVSAAEEGGRVRDLLNIDWSNGPLPLLLFLLLVLGSACLVLALMGARAAQAAPWRAVVAGMLAAALLMVPVIAVANSLVTAGIWNTGGD